MITPYEIRQFHAREDRRVVHRVLDACGTDVARIQQWLHDRAKEQDRAVLMRDALNIAQRAAHLSQVDAADGQLMPFAVDLADATCRRYFYRAGSFVEYDWIPWITPGEEWHTIPWGTAFRGIEMLDTYELICDALASDQRRLKSDALHSSNFGGVRVRFVLAPEVRETDLRLSFFRLRY